MFSSILYIEYNFPSLDVIYISLDCQSVASFPQHGSFILSFILLYIPILFASFSFKTHNLPRFRRFGLFGFPPFHIFPDLLTHLLQPFWMQKKINNLLLCVGIPVFYFFHITVSYFTCRKRPNHVAFG